MSNYNILVTGASGFIGGSIYHSLRKSLDKTKNDTLLLGTTRKLDETCELYQIDLTNKWQVHDIFKKFQFGTIIHCAANPLTDIKKTGINTLWQDNVEATRNLLEMCDSGTKFIYCSSATVYGPESLGKAHGATEEDTPNPQSFYGFTKLTCEKLIEQYCNEGKITGLCARLCAVCGKGASHGVIKDLYNKYVRAKANKEDVEVIGAKPGTEKPYIHINEVTDFLHHAAVFPVDFLKRWSYGGMNQKFQVYNMCNTDTVSVERICEIIKEKLNYDCYENWTGSTWAGDNPKVIMNNRKVQEMCGLWQVVYSEDAIKTTIEEYMQ